jgi:sugar/nucleoside kinase (ribokinase family)
MAIPINLTKATHAYDVAYVGNYTKDTISTPAGTHYVDGGAVNYAAHAGARLGCHIAVVTRLAQEDHDRVVNALRSEGVDCLVTITPQSTCVKLEYPTMDVDVRNLYVTSTAGSITVDEVKQIRCLAAVIGTTLRGEIEMEAIQALRNRSELLAADAQGFVRVLEGQDLVYRPWGAMPEVLKLLDIFKTDVKEAEFLTGTRDIHEAAQSLAAYGPKEVLLTHQDGLLVYAHGEFHAARFYSKTMNGRSGRGDTCTGAYVAKRLSASPAEATRWAAALTSLKMENQGPFKRSLSEVAQLVESKYR